MDRWATCLLLALLLLLLGSDATPAVANEDAAVPDATEPVPLQRVTLEVVAELEGNEARARCLVWHPDGRYLATGYMDRTLRIWDVDERKALASVILPRGG